MEFCIMIYRNPCDRLESQPKVQNRYQQTAKRIINNKNFKFSVGTKKEEKNYFIKFWCLKIYFT